VLRIGGPSTGADDMVATGRRLGKTIFNAVEEIPERRRCGFPPPALRATSPV
jgi:hypothetical protein